MMAMRGYKSHKIIFKLGIKGTGFENNEFLIWTQIFATFILGLCMTAFSLKYLILILPKFLNVGLT
ncbi:MAG: hypothetical protein DCF20_16535 [Pseudanabaena sp.]|nr:MAG: hypothetical protein DCF20_16535 [Pseudanabaena sp.]